MAIHYLYKNPNIKGETCPACNYHGTWNIFKCDNCKKIFCNNCSPKAIKTDPETDDLLVKCPGCGAEQVFYDW